MRYAIDQISSFLGTITICGWVEGGKVPMAWSNARPVYGPIEPFVSHNIERSDLVPTYGPDSASWGFKLVFHVGDQHDPKDLHLLLEDSTRITNLYDRTTEEDLAFWSMLETFKADLRDRGGSLLDIGLPPSGRGLLQMLSVPGADYVGLSDAPGPTVDIVADLDAFSGALLDPVDFIYCVSVFDKVRTPWTLAVELGKVLRPGGIAYVQSAGAWPAGPDGRDFWRFSKRAWNVLFSPEAGFTVLRTAEAGRVRLVLENASTLHRGLEGQHHYTLSGCLVQRLAQTTPAPPQARFSCP